jgi:Cof subfamily protein (haloacid dehalogenase superfamily)
MKLIAIDMDGTLLNSGLIVSKENADAIREAQEQGIEVVIATGRSYHEAVKPLKEAGISTPIIGINGAHVRSSDGEIVSSIPLTPTTYEQIEKILMAEDIYYEVYTNKGTFTNNREKAVEVVVDIIRTSNSELTDEEAYEIAKYRIENGRNTYIPSYDVLKEDEDTEFYKLLCFSRDEKRKQLALERLIEIEELAASASAKDNIEVTNRNAQKGIALKQYARQMNIPLDEVMAIGDNYNDVSMLQIAGISIAMGNAEEEIKKISRYTTKTNDENGVAHAIHQFTKEKSSR